MGKADSDIFERVEKDLGPEQSWKPFLFGFAASAFTGSFLCLSYLFTAPPEYDIPLWFLFLAGMFIFAGTFAVFSLPFVVTEQSVRLVLAIRRKENKLWWIVCRSIAIPGTLFLFLAVDVWAVVATKELSTTPIATSAGIAVLLVFAAMVVEIVCGILVLTIVYFTRKIISSKK